MRLSKTAQKTWSFINTVRTLFDFSSCISRIVDWSARRNKKQKLGKWKSLIKELSLISWSVTLLLFLKKVNFLRTWSAIDVKWISHVGGCTSEPVFSLCVLLKQELNHKEFFVNKPTTSVTGTKYKSFQLHGKVTFLIIVFFVHLFEIYF